MVKMRRKENNERKNGKENDGEGIKENWLKEEMKESKNKW